MTAAQVRPERTPRRKAREYLAECFRALHATDDRFAGWWSSSDVMQRRTLCHLAGVHMGFASMAWQKMPEIDRNAIKRTSVDMHRQLSRLMEWVPERERVPA